MHLPMQRRCAGASPRAYPCSDSESLIRIAERGRCGPITCAPTQAHCVRTQRTHGDTHPHVTRNPSIHAHHAAEEHARAHANKYTCSLSPDAQVYYYHIIMALWHFYLRLWPRARPHVLISCGRAPSSRWSMPLATIAPAPSRPRACCPLRIRIFDVWHDVIRARAAPDSANAHSACASSAYANVHA
jgi:hypothetical protein